MKSLVFKMLVLIDNYDSFTYNLVQYFKILGQDVRVFSHDAISIAELKALKPSYIVISPGPNGPDEAGISMDVIREFYQNTPILGVCLGHQCMAQVFGAKIIAATQILHGKTSRLIHNQMGLFDKLPFKLEVTRYHSLAVDPSTLTMDWRIDAWSDDGTIMAISHDKYPLFGVQFHPEAILSDCGLLILQNFLLFKKCRNLEI